MGKYLNYLILLVIMLYSCRSGNREEGQIIELPVTYSQGFGPFGSSYGFLVPIYEKNNPDAYPWNKTYPEIYGIPKDWKAVVKSMVWLDAYQFVYQNFYQGNIDSSSVAHLKQSWKWEPDTTKLSKLPIRCYIYVIRGKDRSGKVAVMIDTNNNCDFSDEKPFYPENAIRDGTLRNYKMVYRIEYDLVRSGHRTTSFLPMVVKYLPEEPYEYRYWYTFPQYARTSIIIDGNVHEIAVSQGFNSPYAEESRLILAENIQKGSYAKFHETIPLGQHLTVGKPERKFKNLGLDLSRNTLKLMVVSGDDSTYFAKTGDVFRPFNAKDFLTQEDVISTSLRGKYVFIDFWGTWCKGCVEQLPALRNVYKDVNRECIEFVGIASMDDPKRLRRFLGKMPLEWPQILSDSINDLVVANNITSFPSNFLIGPDGKIVHRDISSSELEKVLASIGCMK